MNHTRLLLGTLLLLFLLSLMTYYSLEHNKYDPDNQYILDHYEQYTITKVVLDAKVSSVDRTNNTLYIQISSSPQGLIQVQYRDPIPPTQPGDLVEVYGTFTGKNQMTADTLMIYQQWNYNLIFLRSLPAIPFALYLFFRAYRFNKKTYRFERRKNHA